MVSRCGAHSIDWGSHADEDKVWKNSDFAPAPMDSVTLCDGITYKCKLAGNEQGEDQYVWKKFHAGEDDGEQTHAKCFDASVRAVAEHRHCRGTQPRCGNDFHHNWTVFLSLIHI